jgi:hypothetical protein
MGTLPMINRRRKVRQSMEHQRGRVCRCSHTDPVPPSVFAPPRQRPPGGDVVLQLGLESFSCGGSDGTPWLVAGLVVMALAAVLYWRLTVNT